MQESRETIRLLRVKEICANMNEMNWIFDSQIFSIILSLEYRNKKNHFEDKVETFLTAGGLPAVVLLSCVVVSDWGIVRVVVLLLTAVAPAPPPAQLATLVITRHTSSRVVNPSLSIKCWADLSFSRRGTGWWSITEKRSLDWGNSSWESVRDAGAIIY